MTTRPTIAERQTTPAAGILSVVFLCLAALFAFVYGPLFERGPFASQTKPVSSGAWAPDQHSAPVTHKRLYIVTDWRAIKATAPQDGGKSRAVLLPRGIWLPEPVFASPRSASVLHTDIHPSAKAHGARAPPAYS